MIKGKAERESTQGNRESLPSHTQVLTGLYIDRNVDMCTRVVDILQSLTFYGLDQRTHHVLSHKFISEGLLTYDSTPSLQSRCREFSIEQVAGSI